MEILKKIIPLLTVILCFAVWFQCVSAETHAVKAETDKTSVAVDGVFELLINADLKGVTGIQFDIEYDPDNAEYLNSELGELLSEAFVSGIEKKIDGNVTMVAAFTESCDISGKLCSVEFKAVGNDIKLHVKNIKLMIDGEKVSEEDTEVEIKVKGRRKESGGGSLSGGNGSQDKEEIKTPEENNEKISDSNDDSSPINDKNGIENNKAEEVFDDITGHWAYESIMFMSEEGIINGVGDGKFAPDRELTRAEFAVLIVGTLNLEETSEYIYEDVDNESWYAESVLKCTKEKIMMGDGEKFRPFDSVTREEAAAVIARAAEYLEISFPSNTQEKVFSDTDMISQWAEKSIYEMVNAGIISGYDDGRFGAKDMTTRAHAAVMLTKLLKLQWGEAA